MSSQDTRNKVRAKDKTKRKVREVTEDEKAKRRQGTAERMKQNREQLLSEHEEGSEAWAKAHELLKKREV